MELRGPHNLRQEAARTTFSEQSVRGPGSGLLGLTKVRKEHMPAYATDIQASETGRPLYGAGRVPTGPRAARTEPQTGPSARPQTGPPTRPPTGPPTGPPTAPPIGSPTESPTEPLTGQPTGLSVLDFCALKLATSSLAIHDFLAVQPNPIGPKSLYYSILCSMVEIARYIGSSTVYDRLWSND